MIQQIKSAGMKQVLIALAGIVYVVGIIYADVFFLQVVQGMFPAGILRVFATVGAFLAGATAVLLPVSVHYWFSPGKQKIVGYIFYALDITIMVLNVILAFQISQGSVDANLALWRDVCPATPVFCIIGWGIIWMLDNSHAIRDMQIALEHAQITRIAQGMEAGMNSPEALEYLNQVGINAMWAKATHLSNTVIPLPGKNTSPLPVVPLLNGNNNSHDTGEIVVDPLASRVPPKSKTK